MAVAAPHGNWTSTEDNELGERGTGFRRQGEWVQLTQTNLEGIVGRLNIEKIKAILVRDKPSRFEVEQKTFSDDEDPAMTAAMRPDMKVFDQELDMRAELEAERRRKRIERRQQAKGDDGSKGSESALR
jgi:hypothetical protein